MASNLIIDNRAGRMTSREINVITTGAEKRSITGERVSIVRFGIFVSNATSHPVSTNGDYARIANTNEPCLLRYSLVYTCPDS